MKIFDLILPALKYGIFGIGDLFGGGGSQQTTSQSSAPWGGVQPFLTDIFKQAQSLNNGSGTTNPNQTAAYGMINNLATGSNPLNTSANNLATDTINGKYLSPDSNPYLQQNVDKALNDVQTRVNSQFSGNNYGSSANQEMLTRNLGDTAASMYGQNYTNERNNQQQALSMTPSLNANNYYGANQLAAAGNDQQSSIWKGLQNYGSILGLGSNGGTSTSTQNGEQSSSPLSTIAGIASIASSLFSDERLKSNISRVGTHPLGIGVYEYDKFGKRERGLLAQEVEQVMPEAVTEHASGYKKVNYGLLN